MVADSVVLSTSLFGTDIKHLGGALQCTVELSSVRERLGPVSLVVYHDSTVPESTLSALSRSDDVTLVSVTSDWAGLGTLGSIYRFLGFYEYRTAAMVITWDLDNTLNSGLLDGLIASGRQHNASFSFMRKRNPPRKRLFNADCWVAWPSRNPEYETLSRGAIDRIASYFHQHPDTTYGCDERAQCELVKELLLRPKGEYRLLKTINEQFSLDGQSYDYDTAQREVLSGQEYESLEAMCLQRAAEAQQRTTSLSDFGFPRATDLLTPARTPEVVSPD